MARNGTYTIEEPYRQAVSVTPSDTTVLAPTDAIWVNGGGDVVVTMANGSDNTFTLAASQGLNISVTKVKAASTATGIKALYR